MHESNGKSRFELHGEQVNRYLGVFAVLFLPSICGVPFRYFFGFERSLGGQKTGFAKSVLEQIYGLAARMSVNFGGAPINNGLFADFG